MPLPNSLTLLAATTLLVGGAIGQCSNYTLTPAGTRLIDADDAIYNVALPFGFPFDGAVYNSITVSTNGWIKLGQASATSSQTADGEVSMLSGDPRLAVLWDDLNPSSATGSGGLYYSADATQASITWQGVQRFGATQVGTRANCECILTPSGDIYFVYDATCTFNLSNSSSMVGISRGNNLVAAGISFVDWSGANPGPISVVNATAYESFPVGAFDLANTGIVLHFAPTGVDTYDVSYGSPLAPCIAPGSYPDLAIPPAVTSAGCPSSSPNSSLYELFSNDVGATPMDTDNTSILFAASSDVYLTAPGFGFDTNYTGGQALTLLDEQLLDVSVGAMGTFPFGDLSVTSLRISSNGWIGLNQSFASADYQGNALKFNSEGPRIAGCWVDFDPTAGGSIYYDNTDPSFCMLTFDSVPEYGQPSNVCTWQVKLFATGDILISHGTVGAVATYLTPIVGITRGAANDPGSSDLVTSGVPNIVGPVDIVGINSMSHSASVFAIGKGLDMTGTYSGSIIGFFILGFTNPALPLDGLGAPGCILASSLDLIFPALFSGSSISYSIPTIPYNPAFSGLTFFTQAAAFSNDNAFGIVTSNGLTYVMGL